MERKMLHGIKQRAESLVTSGGSHAEHQPQLN
jgi:hypothetical protein